MGSAALVLVLGSPALSAAPVASIDGSPDVTVTLSSVTITDGEIAQGLQGLPVAVALGLPAEVSVEAFDWVADGSVLFAVGTPVELGGTVFFPSDVIRWNGSVYTKYFDGAANGVPAGAKIDAIALDGSDLLLSFDVGMTLSGSYFPHGDLVRWDGVAFASFFDAVAAGVDPALDLDGADRLANGLLYLSFDGSGEVGGVPFADEDILQYDSASGGWALAFDGSVASAAWLGADLDALTAGFSLVEIPALDGWGLLALALLLVAGAWTMLRRAGLRRARA